MLHRAIMAQEPAIFPGIGIEKDERRAAPGHGALIVRIARERDKAAFIELFRHFAPRVKSYLMKGGMAPAEAEELAQETMLALWRKAEDFDPAKAAASTWIFTIARNKKIDALRRRHGHGVSLEDVAPLIDDAPSATEGLMRAEETEKIAAAMKDLPPEQADLIRRSFFEGKAHGDIAAETGLPLGTVKSRLRLALERLRKQPGLRELAS